MKIHYILYTSLVHIVISLALVLVFLFSGGQIVVPEKLYHKQTASNNLESFIEHNL
jgi:hypothetical protein